MKEDGLTDHEQESGVVRHEPSRYIPPCPGVSGYHWIRRYPSGPAVPLYWNAEWYKNGGDGWGRWAEPDRENKWAYCGACLSPDDRDGARLTNITASEIKRRMADPGTPANQHLQRAVEILIGPSIEAVLKIVQNGERA